MIKKPKKNPTKKLSFKMYVRLWILLSSLPYILGFLALVAGFNLLDGYGGSAKTNTPFSEFLAELAYLTFIFGLPLLFIAGITVAYRKMNTDGKKYLWLAAIPILVPFTLFLLFYARTMA